MYFLLASLETYGTFGQKKESTNIYAMHSTSQGNTINGLQCYFINTSNISTEPVRF